MDYPLQNLMARPPQISEVIRNPCFPAWSSTLNPGSLKARPPPPLPPKTLTLLWGCIFFFLMGFGAARGLPPSKFDGYASSDKRSHKESLFSGLVVDPEPGRLGMTAQNSDLKLLFFCSFLSSSSSLFSLFRNPCPKNFTLLWGGQSKLGLLNIFWKTFHY